MLKLVPYHFVPLGKNKRTLDPVDPLSAELLEGKISCTLTIKTPLFIPNTSGEPKISRNARKTRVFYSLTQLSGEITERSGSPKQPVIPGSSIRGMLRNVHEAASDGCLHILSGKRNDFNWERILDIAEKNGHYAPCKGTQGDLCPTCSLFGMVGRGDEEDTHAGRIRVGDARAVESAVFGEFRWLPKQMEPKISAVEFYTYVPDEKTEKWTYNHEALHLKGRKFYWHHQPVRDPKEEARYANDRFCSFVQPIETGTFSFDVFFDGITEDELRQLAALIHLRGRDGFKRQFKLGNAKAHGYGSVETGIQSVSIRRLILEDGNILHKQEDATAKYQDVRMEDAFGRDLTDLMTILDPRTLGGADVRVEYPDQRWYKNQTMLEKESREEYSRADYIASHKLGTIAKVKEEADKHPKETGIGSYTDPQQQAQVQAPVQYTEEYLKPVSEDDLAAIVSRSRFVRNKKRK